MKPVKRVLFFISKIGNTGGTERVCIAIANELAKRGYEISILSMFGCTPFFKVSDSIKLKAVFEKKRDLKLILPFAIYKIRRKMAALNPDVIVNVDSALFIYSQVAAIGMGIKKIVWEHFNFKVSQGSVARIWSRRLAANFCDVVVTLTDRDRAQWLNNLRCKCPVIAITNPSSYPVTQKTVPPKENIVLSVGRLTFQKGFDLLIETWNLIDKRAGVGDWKLFIVGSGEMEKELQDLIGKYSLEQSIQLLPATPQVDIYYRMASIYCLTSRYEGFPLVLLEAQSFGLPLISFDCETGPAEIIVHGSNGLLAPDKDVTILSELLERQMHDENSRQKMQEAALKESAKYDLAAVAAQWDQFLKSLSR
jgi:glycosyltransferase involved in cell wall biosynthesis